MKIFENFFVFLREYKLNSLFYKNFIKILIIFLIPIFTIIFIFYYNSKNILIKEIYNDDMNVLQTAKMVTDSILSEADLISAQFASSQNVRNFLQFQNSDAAIALLNESIKTEITNLTNVYQYINSIYIYSQKSNYIISSSNISDLKYMSDSGWYSDYLQCDIYGSTMYFRTKNNVYPYLITIIRPIIKNNEKVGAIIVNIDTEQLKSAFNIIDEKSNEFFMLLDKIVVFCTDSEKIGMQIFKDSEMQTIKSVEDKFVGNILLDGKKCHSSIVKSDKKDIYYISCMDSDVYTKRFNKQFANIYLILAVIIILCIFTVFLISMVSFESVRRIIAIVDTPEEFEKELKSFSHKNEIRHMMFNILNKYDNRQKAEEMLAIQLRKVNLSQAVSLQSQINVHFLSNVLDTINWRSIELLSFENEISEMLVTLGKIMENGLDINNFVTSVDYETDYTKNYVSLLQIRYPDKFSVEWNIAPEVRTADILRLSIQPVIENAIYHGIKPKNSKGIIKVSIFNDSGTLTIIIEDNGIGIRSEDLINLRQHILKGSLKTKRHIGLSNINQRIRLIFGDKYGVCIDSIYGEFTKITITLPYSNSNDLI